MSEWPNKTNGAHAELPNCDAIAALIPAYSLGAADPDERKLVEANLQRCPDAAVLLVEFAALTERLHYAVPSQEVPPQLADKLMTAVWASIEPAAQPMTHHPKLHSTSRPALWQIAAALVILLLIGSNIYWWKRLDGVLNDQRNLADRSDTQGAVLAFLATGKAQHVVLLPSNTATASPEATTPTALLICDPEGTVGLLHVEHFPLSTVNYQLWFWQGQQAVNIGEFRVTPQGSSDTVFRAPQAIAGYTRAEISVGLMAGGQSVGTSIVSGELYSGSSSR